MPLQIAGNDITKMTVGIIVNAVNKSLLGNGKNGSDRTSSEEGRFILPSM